MAEAARKQYLERFTRERRIEAITKWFLFVVSDEKSLTDEEIKLFLDQLLVSAQGCLGLSSQPSFVIRANPSEILSFRARLEPFMDRVKESDFVLVILPGDEKNSPYFSIVKKMFFDLRVSRQCVIFKTVRERNPRILQAICTQINRKLVQCRDLKLTGKDSKRQLDPLTFGSKPQPLRDMVAADQELNMMPDSESISAQLKTEITQVMHPNVTKITIAETVTFCAPKSPLYGVKTPPIRIASIPKFGQIIRTEETKSVVRKHPCKFSDLKLLLRSPLYKHARSIHSSSARPSCYCARCGKRYPLRYRLINHLEKAHGTLLLGVKHPIPPGSRIHSKATPPCCYCARCGKRYPRRYRLVDHLDNAHGTLLRVSETPIPPGRRQEFPCATCGKIFYSMGSRYRHTLRHRTPTSLSCAVCASVLSTKFLLTRHCFERHYGCQVFLPRKRQSYGCSRCLKTFRKRRGLASHLLRHRAGADRRVSRCRFCGFLFSQKHELELHLTAVHTNEFAFACSVCDAKFESAIKLRQHGRSHVARRHRCARCGQTFLNERGKRLHIATMHTAKLVCDHCSSEFWSRTHRLIHMRRVHGAVARDAKHTGTCSICMKTMYKGSVATHERLVHHGVRRSIPCLYCDQIFFHYFARRKHMWADHPEESAKLPHLLLQSYACDFCPRKFDWAHEKAEHELRKHTDLRPYACDECGKAYCTPNDLRQHKYAVHTLRYYCELCNAPFQQKRLLDDHVTKIHWGQTAGHFFGESERVYFYCPACPAVLRTEASRDKHMKNMHGPEPSFRCEFCDKRFPYAYRYKQHVRKAHPKQVASASTDAKPVVGVPAEGLLAMVKLEDEPIQDDASTSITPSIEAASLAVKTEPLDAVVVVPLPIASPFLITTTRVQVPRIVLGNGFQKIVLTLPNQGRE